MPNVPVYFLLGGDNAEGGNAASTLSPSFPQFVGAQTGYKVWNAVAGAWQVYQAGENSAPASTVDVTRFGPEVSMLSRMQTENPGQATIYLFKSAKVSASLAAQPSTNNEWAPAANELYAAMLADWLTARSMLPFGTTPDVQGVFWVHGEADAVLDRHPAYASLMQTLITRLRADLAIPQLPIVIGKLHNHHAVAQPTKGYYLSVRDQQQSLLDRDNFIFVANTDHLALKVDSSTYSTAGSIELGYLLMDTLVAGLSSLVVPAAPSDSAVPIYLLIGDRNALGQAPIGEIPGYLSSTLSGAKIWNHTAGAFQDILAGTNNDAPASKFGPEVSMLYELRRKHDAVVYLVKHAVAGAPLAPKAGAGNEWNPGAGEAYADLFSKVEAAAAALRTAALEPGIRGVFVVHGEAEAADAARASLYEEYLKLLVAHLRQDLRAAGLAGDNLVVSIAKLSGKNSGSQVGLLRAAQQGIFDQDDYVGIFDTSDLSVNSGTFDFNGLGAVELGQQLVTHLDPNLGATVQPIFVTDLAALKRQLRMSQVAKGTDVDEILRQAILVARQTFFNRLGGTRLNLLLKLPRTSRPDTEEEYLRSIAAATEVRLVTAELMRTLPTILEAGQSLLKVWNEAGFRRGMPSDLKEELTRLATDIEQNFQLLNGSKLLGGSVSGTAFVIEPDPPQWPIGWPVLDKQPFRI